MLVISWVAAGLRTEQLKLSPAWCVSASGLYEERLVIISLLFYPSIVSIIYNTTIFHSDSRRGVLF